MRNFSGRGPGSCMCECVVELSVKGRYFVSNVGGISGQAGTCLFLYVYVC